MKKTIMVLLMGAFMYSAAIAQKITTDKVPVLVYRAFKSKFQGASQESWSKESKSVFEVEFFNDRKKQSAEFDSSGAWRETETQINLSQLPRAVSASFNKQFGGFTVQETTSVETADRGTLYELVINKGKEGYEVQFSADGKLLKKEEAKAED